MNGLLFIIAGLLIIFTGVFAILCNELLTGVIVTFLGLFWLIAIAWTGLGYD